jgi:hypothetical protein
MLRFVKIVGAAALLAFGLESALGFSLMGPPNEPWQTPVIGYMVGGDIGTPHNLGEEYRWNTPTIYYTYDQNFLDYFASNGVWAVDQAVAILNGLTNFSLYTPSLYEVPLETRRFNYTAQELHLMDLKTTALFLMLEELGLTDSERFVWTLRTRNTQPGLSCPYMYYDVIHLSFDPANWQPSSYINNTLYTYYIQEICSGNNPLAVTVPFSVDPLATESLPASSESGVLNYGLYVTGLTRDDVGGLRYSYEPTNINWEAMSSDSIMFYTNIAGGQQLLFTSNLTTFAAQALTNTPAALLALYPTLSIASTTNVFTNIYVTNITAYYTNYPWSPYGSAPSLVLVTNLTLTVQNWYHDIFNNVMTFQQLANGAWVMVPLPDVTTHTGLAWLTVQTTYLTNYPWDPYGTPPHTNTTSVTYPTEAITGEYYILPTNLCGIAVAGLQATLLTYDTNVVLSATNATVGYSNSYVETVIDYFTNHAFLYYPVDCVTTNVTLRQGIDKFTFVKANYDSLVGRFFQPITNLYTLVTVTNSGLVTNWYQRVVYKPDFLFTAQDTTDSAGLGFRSDTYPNFNTNNENLGLAGPGNIDPGVSGPNATAAIEIVFNKVGPLLENVYDPDFLLNGLTESTATTNFIWGSFDGTTNAPVVYPDGSSIMNLEAQILFQIITPFLPDGQVGNLYPPTQLQVAGAPVPYSWSWSGGVPVLPPGLNLSAGGVISGTPTAAGTYVFNVTVTGTGADTNSTTRTLQVIIEP